MALVSLAFVAAGIGLFVRQAWCVRHQKRIGFDGNKCIRILKLNVGSITKDVAEHESLPRTARPCQHHRRKHLKVLLETRLYFPFNVIHARNYIIYDILHASGTFENSKVKL